MRTEAAARMPDFSREVYCLLGVPLDRVDLAGAEQRIRAAAAVRSPCFLSTPNVNFLVACQSDAAFRDSIVDSDLSIADGMPLVWLAGLAGIPIRQRVAGSALFEALRDGHKQRLSVYFFGGPDGVAELAGRRLGLESRGLACAGYQSPGFGSVEEMSGDEVIERINASNADVLLVSIGARKGQAWIDRNRARLKVPVISYMGAVLHFAAGTLRRAPAWMQCWGLEWLWRIREEPHLWRRYFDDGTVLLGLLATRVLPYAWYAMRHRPGAEQLASARTEAHESAQGYAIRLHGVWTQANVARLRRCFYHAALAGKDVALDMAGVAHVDSAFIGLLMLLQSHQRRHGRQLRISSVRVPVRRVFRYSCAEYLCEEAHS